MVSKRSSAPVDVVRVLKAWLEWEYTPYSGRTDEDAEYRWSQYDPRPDIESVLEDHQRLDTALTRAMDRGTREFQRAEAYEKALEHIANGDMPSGLPSWVSGKSWRIELARQTLKSAVPSLDSEQE